MGRIFLLKIDNVSIKHLFDQEGLNARQERWLAFLSESYIEVKHIKGKENWIGGTIIRRINQISTLTKSSYQTNLPNEVKVTIENDEIYQKMHIKIQNKNTEKKDLDFNLNKEGLLMFKNRLYIPNDVELKLLILNMSFIKDPFQDTQAIKK